MEFVPRGGHESFVNSIPNGFVGTSLHFRGIPLLKIQATVSVISMLLCVSNNDLQIGKKSSIKSSILHYLDTWEILLGLSVLSEKNKLY